MGQKLRAYAHERDFARLRCSGALSERAEMSCISFGGMRTIWLSRSGFSNGFERWHRGCVVTMRNGDQKPV